MKIILLGAPGAGKGSVGKPLSEKLMIPVISTGDIFRENIRNSTDLGKLAQKYIEQGNLVPDEVTVSIVEDRIKRDDCNNGFILDGFPRTVEQADRFSSILADKETGIDLVINIKLDDDIIIKRLSSRRVCNDCGEPYNLVTKNPEKEGVCDKCGGNVVQRADDREETIRKRLETYYKQTLPLVKYYESLGILETMDNDCSVEEALQRACEIVNEHKKGNC